ncbi:MAG: hypothetical protein QM831_10965 [Kofleriaceae bacterium]
MRLAIAAGIAAIVALVIFLAHSTEPKGPLVATDPPPQIPRVPPKAELPKIDHVQKLSKGDRADLADRIAGARARGSATAPMSVGKPPSLTPVSAGFGDPANPDATKDTIRSAMREVLPLLAECYNQAAPQLPEKHLQVEAKITLTGDPDIGTVIDAHQITDDKGRPILASFDDCLRDTMQQLALPALAADKLEITYPFVFSTD